MLSEQEKSDLRAKAVNGKLPIKLQFMSYATVEEMYNNGAISELNWNLYRYIWRNSVIRFSDIAFQFEDKPLHKYKKQKHQP